MGVLLEPGGMLDISRMPSGGLTTWGYSMDL